MHKVGEADPRRRRRHPPHDGCNVAMGWDRSHSVAAADLILQQWKEQEGYEFVTIPEMIERSGFSVP